MSVVVGIEAPGGVWLAADACMSSTEQDAISGKIFGRDDCGFGVVGSVRHAQAIRFCMPGVRAPKPGDDAEQWAVTKLVPAARQLVTDAHLWEPSDKPEDKGLLLLVAVRGCVLYLQEDWAAYRPLHGYAAIGSGSAVALGALAATPRISPNARARRAVHAAIRHCPGVCGPVTTLWVPE